MKLNLGSGHLYKEGWINLDIGEKDIYGNKNKVDVIWNLNIYPWKPLKNNQFKEIDASAIIEHLSDRTKPWDEIRRISKNGCIVHVRVPHFSGYNFYDDPTHEHAFSQHTAYKIAQMWKFRVLKSKIMYSMNNPFLKWMNPVVNLFPRFYERFFAFIIPSQELLYDFEVIK